MMAALPDVIPEDGLTWTFVGKKRSLYRFLTGLKISDDVFLAN